MISKFLLSPYSSVNVGMRVPITVVFMEASKGDNLGLLFIISLALKVLSTDVNTEETELNKLSSIEIWKRASFPSEFCEL